MLVKVFIKHMHRGYKNTVKIWLVFTAKKCKKNDYTD